MEAPAVEAQAASNGSERKAVGFALKAAKKKAVIVAAEDKPAEQREIITGVENNAIESTAPAPKGPLVIPLPEKDRRRIEENKTAQPQGEVPMEVAAAQPAAQSLDEIAARELINELNNGGAATESNITIDVDTTNTLVVDKRRKPILLENQPEELAGVTDEDDRYKLDLALRPDDIDVRSERYQAVPVTEFGAAMLRGMGWSGPTKEDEERAKNNFLPVPREARLGLGATPKPPEAKDKRKPTAKEKEKAWKEAAAARLQTQQLEDDDIVWLRSHTYAGLRARIVQARGVPGLDQILVQLEGQHDAVKVGKRDAVLVPLDELEAKPFTTPKIDVGPKTETHQQDDDPFRMRDQGRDDQPKKRRRDEHSDRDTERDRERDHDRERDRDRGHSRSSDKHGSDRSKEDRGSVQGWLRPRVRVRVVSKKAGSRHYLKKGTVTDVPTRGVAVVQMDTGEVLTDMKEKYLETVLPAIDGECVVLVGERAGETARVLEKLKEREKVTVQYADDLQVETLPMDHVATVAP